MSVSDLPVRAVTAELDRRLAERGAAVLCAPPGSGKTTQVPLAMLDADWLRDRRVVVLEPRRVAARAAARFMAALLGESVGERVGFRVRFESAVSQRTRIEVVTEGVLTRRLQRDPELAGVGLVIFDEFHERSLECDLALALTLDVRHGLREDLRVLVMSATLDAEPIARLLGNVPVIEAGGRPFPVAIEYLARDTGVPLAGLVGSAVRRVLREREGDVLVFLPGAREIRAAERQLIDVDDVLICPLHGDLPAAEQDRAIQRDPGGRRRVVLATNIAETSLTIEGVTTVVDSGLARRPRFDPNTGLTRLHTVSIARASAEQRAGRAGRTSAGGALRLWTRAAHALRAEHESPEMRGADLAGLALELARWGVRSPADLRWLDPPPQGSFEQALDLLRCLGALDDAGRITPAGRRMCTIPAHPRIARMVMVGSDEAARDDGASVLATDLAAVLEGPDPVDRDDAGCDVRTRVQALARYRTGGSPERSHSRALAACERIASQLRTSAGVRRREAPEPELADPELAGRSLLAGFPDRLAQRRSQRRGSFRLVGGRGLNLPGDDPLAAADYLVVPDLDAGAVDARAYKAAPVSLRDIRLVLGEQIRWRRHVAWDARAQCVQAVEEEQIGMLVLRSRPAADAQPDELVQAMLDGVRRLGLDALPWTDSLRQLRARIESLRQWQPEAGWPAMNEHHLTNSLEDWLAPFLAGVMRRDQLARIDLGTALRARIAPSLRSRLERDAPARLSVPGGSSIALEYRPGEPPVLAVRLQEMLGCTQTPAVCSGRVPVQVHLLSPAGRPLHVTQDLASFWRNAYPEVRKEMRGRYPKHPWPEDPLSAQPTRHAKRRR
ncbi:MAG: ATP-dependent helicase HrpB [Gammaproteobacteria bacterium]